MFLNQHLFDGLYLIKELSTDTTKYEKPEEMKKMIQEFRENIAVQMFTDKEYEELLGTPHIAIETVAPLTPRLDDEIPY